MRPLFSYVFQKNPVFGRSINRTFLMSCKRSKSVVASPSLFQDKQLGSTIHTTKWYSTNIYTPSAPVALTGTAVAKDESREFMAVFPDIVRDLTDAGRHLDIPDVTKWYAKVLQYNVPGGKKNRGLALVTAYRVFCPPAELTPENIRLAHVLGWCIEMLQAFLLILDDIMDEAETRRGRPCWFRLDDTNNIAINDGILVENGIYVILKKYFKDKPYYLNIVEAFHDTILKTSMGQSLDMLTCHAFQKNKKLEKFTMDRYKAIVKYKTAYYSFHLPVALSMYMSGISDPERHRQVEYILLEMGHYFQIQDDYLDCFGNVDVIGKVGTDIQDGKCTWLIVVALQRATAQQKQTLEQCYGSNDPKDVETVKQIYKDIGLPSIFAAYEEDAYKLIVDQIQKLSRGVPQNIFFKILDKIYKRSN